jgi:hypothetical protein
LDVYSHGDACLRRKLIELMIENILELQQALSASIDQCNQVIFQRTSHKVTTTLTIINSRELTDLVEDLKNCSIDSGMVVNFNQLCDAIIKALIDENR